MVQVANDDTLFCFVYKLAVIVWLLGINAAGYGTKTEVSRNLINLLPSCTMMMKMAY